jgi:hypothetical protein
MIPSTMTKPSAESERAEKEQWIRAKYVDLAFMAKEDQIAILVRCWRGGIGRPSPHTQFCLYYVAQCFLISVGAYCCFFDFGR